MIQHIITNHHIPTPPPPPLPPTDKYAVRFIPRENGLYLIDVKFNGSHIPGSPFKIRVGEMGQAGDPGMVSAYGAGLEGGTTGIHLYTTSMSSGFSLFHSLARTNLSFFNACHSYFSSVVCKLSLESRLLNLD